MLFSINYFSCIHIVCVLTVDTTTACIFMLILMDLFVLRIFLFQFNLEFGIFEFGFSFSFVTESMSLISKPATFCCCSVFNMNNNIINTYNAEVVVNISASSMTPSSDVCKI